MGSVNILKGEGMKFKEKCLESWSHVCPYCGSNNVNWDKAEQIGDGSYFRGNDCSDCDKMWASFYELVRIEEY